MSCLAEDEVDGAGDFAAGVELGAGVREEGVLVAEEADAIVALVWGVGGEGEVLAVGVDVAEGVEDIDVVHFEVCAPGADGGGEIVVGCIDQGEVVGNVDCIAGIGGGVLGVAEDGKIGGPGR